MDDMEGPNPLTLPPVVKTLCKFLPAKSLCSAARVCKLWRSQAERCLQQRQQYSWQYFVEDRLRCTVLEKMRQYFEEIPFIPRVVMVFMTVDFWEDIGRWSYGWKRKHADTSIRLAWRQFCDSVLPSNCQVFCSVTYGIVGTSSDMSYTAEKDYGKCASMLCFGDYPGMQVSLRRSRGNVHCLFSKEPDRPSLEDVKMLLLMSGFPGVSPTIQDIRQELPQVLVVGGIIVTSCVHGVRPDQETSNQEPARVHRQCDSPYCVVFQGKDVQVACVKLDQDIAREDKAEQIIKKLKEKTRSFPMERSIAFMYACVARGHNLYGKHDVEASLFRKHFPSTPLLGLFGNGEIGCEYPFPDGVCMSADMQHAYTTFFAVVSLP